MKKTLLSSTVIGAFIIYAIIARASGSTQAQPLVQKPNATNTPTSSQIPPTTTPVSTDTPTPTIAPTQTATPTPVGKYKDGIYTGDPADAFYGNIQVQATIAGGKITNVTFLQAPSDRSTSVFINNQADPVLAQEAIQVQSANVDVVSGATDSSQAFIQSLQSALNQAK